MEFSEQYLTYEEYRSLGGTLDLTSFNLLEFEAHRKIDSMTQNRLVNETNIPKEVKICVYNLINTLQTYTNKKNRNVQSEHVGEYSVSYGGNIKELIQSKNEELNDIIINDLYGVIVNNEHILYAGV